MRNMLVFVTVLALFMARSAAGFSATGFWVIGTNDAGPVGQTSATFNGTSTLNDASCLGCHVSGRTATASFLYSTSSPPDLSSASQETASSNFALELTGLACGTLYYYRATATRFSLTRTSSAIQSFTTAPCPDTAPPTPNPSTWQSVPQAGGTDTVSMTATTASDPSGGIEYRFDFTGSAPGGTSRDWSASPTYTDTGLTAGTSGYCYTTQSRDAPGNQTTASTPLCAQTDAPPDTTAAILGVLDVLLSE
jgi:hypothetical protein